MEKYVTIYPEGVEYTTTFQNAEKLMNEGGLFITMTHESGCLITPKVICNGKEVKFHSMTRHVSEAIPHKTEGDRIHLSPLYWGRNFYGGYNCYDVMSDEL